MKVLPSGEPEMVAALALDCLVIADDLCARELVWIRGCIFDANRHTAVWRGRKADDYDSVY